MEIVIVVLLALILAALVFAWTRLRPGAHGSAGGLSRGAGGVRGRRRAAVAAPHDPMAEAVERHSRATDPQEAAEEELRLRAQANRVAADLHARQAASLDAEAAAPRDGRRSLAPREDDPPPY
jgi:hypothetical protein